MNYIKKGRPSVVIVMGIILSKDVRDLIGRNIDPLTKITDIYTLV